jgi:hypothetical protein
MWIDIDACPVNASDERSFDFVLTRSLMKLCTTGSNLIIAESRCAFKLTLLSEVVKERIVNFLREYCQHSNMIEAT